MKNQAPNANSLANAHTPVTLMTIFANAFKLEQDNSSLWLKGIYRNRERESYNGFYFDRLQDEFSGQIITIKLPEQIKQTIQDGRFYLFNGILEKDIRRDGVIEPVFIVTKMATQLAYKESPRVDTRTALKQQKTSASYRDLDRIVSQKFQQNKQPHIALINGKTSIVLQDVFTALKETKNQYRFTEHKVNLSAKQAIIQALMTCNTPVYDAVAIVRGGGPGLEIFDDVEIAETGLKLQPVLVTAMGHAQDVTLLQQLADKKFTTPTALGNHLRELATVESAKSIQHRVEQTAVSESSSTHFLQKIPVAWLMFSLVLLIIGVIVGLMLSGQ